MKDSVTDASNQAMKKTQYAFIWTRILGVPFWGLLSLLSIILYKDMHITPLQVTAIISLKPMSALFGPYWSQAIYQRPHYVASNLFWANVLRYLPFLFVPWINSPWIIIAAFGIYMIFYRGSIPAWMEMIKCNLPPQARERLIAYGSTIDYCGTALLPLFLGILLDEYEQSWRWIFPATAIVGLLSSWFLYKLPLSSLSNQENVEDRAMPGFYSIFKEQILKPWKLSMQLVKEHSGFANFLIGFMLGGAGLMVIQPVLPMFFVDTLNLSYTKMLLALTVCKGIGLLFTSPFWIKLFRKIDIHSFGALVAALFALFPLLLMGAEAHIYMLYLAYGIYGVMQGGSELSWHMSGLVFAEEKESTIFSGTNVLTVGIRGCIVPSLGAFLYSISNSTCVMLFGSFLCLLAMQHLFRYSRSLQPVKNS